MALFAHISGGWQRLQAICDYVHDRIEFGYHHARCDRTAAEGHEERIGVCRDFAHLAITLCRCMNILARYCTGYLGDIGVPLSTCHSRANVANAALKLAENGGKVFASLKRQRVSRDGVCECVVEILHGFPRHHRSRYRRRHGPDR